MMLVTNFPEKKNNLTRPKQYPLLPHSIAADLRREPWPTIVLEVGNSEPVSKLIENRISRSHYPSATCMSGLL